jgi:hypothetical protein
MNEAIKHIFVQGILSIPLQVLALYALTLITLGFRFWYRRDEVYVTSWQRLFSQAFLMAVMFYPILCLGVTAREAEGHVFRCVLAGGFYAVSSFLNERLGARAPSLVALTERQVYFFETDQRMLHRTAAIATLMLIMLMKHFGLMRVPTMVSHNSKDATHIVSDSDTASKVTVLGDSSEKVGVGPSAGESPNPYPGKTELPESSVIIPVRDLSASTSLISGVDMPTGDGKNHPAGMSTGNVGTGNPDPSGSKPAEPASNPFLPNTSSSPATEQSLPQAEIREQAESKTLRDSQDEHIFDDRRAVLRYQQFSAVKGNPQAQYAMALRYLHGIDVPKDPEKAAQFLKSARSGGELRARDKILEIEREKRKAERAAMEARGGTYAPPLNQ